VQTVVLRHRTLEPTSLQLELSVQDGQCRAVIRRLVEGGPMVAEFPASGILSLSDLRVGAALRLGRFRFERLSDVYRIRYREGSTERECLFVSYDDMSQALMRLASPAKSSLVA
jgi:hypothetical protein